MTTSNPLKNNTGSAEGILLVDKPKGKTSFSLISALRKILNVQKIGHAGTLDPMATGVMVILVGKRFTTLSDQLLGRDKEYFAEVTLGQTTDTYDAEGEVTAESDVVPTLEDLKNALKHFQGKVEQTPPMFSAKKQNGKKLYELARQGQVVERPKVTLEMTTELVDYQYPKVTLAIACSKGTYVRSIAHDLGEMLGCGAHLSGLTRSKSGSYSIGQCLQGSILFEASLSDAKTAVIQHLRHSV
jgi:tRNA pseudouridine55 synthase